MANGCIKIKATGLFNNRARDTMNKTSRETDADSLP